MRWNREERTEKEREALKQEARSGQREVIHDSKDIPTVLIMRTVTTASTRLGTTRFQERGEGMAKATMIQVPITRLRDVESKRKNFGKL